jgi:hypothetical protein
VDDPPPLRPPDQILRALIARTADRAGPLEKVYLQSLNPRHRWARSSFSGVEEEFRYKTIWVAKLLRDRLGSPDHAAFVSLRHSSVPGVRAAAWLFGPVVGYVVEREALWSRRSRRIILGAVAPRSPPPADPDGLDARDAVWILGQRVLR